MRRNLKMMDKPLFFLIIIMSLFGLFMIFSASYVKASLIEGNTYKYLIRQGSIIIIGFLAYFIILNIPLSKYKKIINVILYGIIGLLIYLIANGKVINGSRSWLDFGYFNLQPSELAKTVLILYMAIYYSTRKFTEDNYIKILKPFIFGAIIVGLVFMQPDLGTALIIMAIMVATYLAVPIKKEFNLKIFKVVSFIVGSIVLLVVISSMSGKSILNESQKQRLNFFNPCDRYTEVGPGYQVCNGYIAINGGGLFGKGIGNSTQKYLYLPESHTDFIFPIIIEELGVLVGILILLMYFYIIYRILLISKASNGLMGGIIGYGISSYLFFQTLVNIGGVLGLIPLTGVPLPFLSYGGSFTLNLFISFALIQRVSIENNLFKKEEAIRNKIREQ
ncbi:MAG: FtsW/RodA/SpoVE family cell cycle protein [Tenericutes bacterium]|nr:FtsW/RodA/SpoVE family cell cycle protein [Mycoplasmatota bacterium]